jgi:multiple sugar transport system substrate-binding protein
VAIAVAVIGLTACGTGGDEETGGANVLNWYVFNEPGGAFKEAAKACNKQSGGRYEIKIVPLPTDANQQRELIVRRLAAEDESVDLIGMDVIWTAEFAEAGWIKEWKGQDAQQAVEGAIPATVETAKYQGRLFAAPYTSNAQVLYYRKDLVPQPPQTWDEMIEIGERLGDKGLIQIQGARYEGLTVWFNTLVESAGGSVLDEEGNVSLGDPAIKAAEIMSRLANSSVADPALSNNREDQARLNFEAGNSAFELNYTFAFASARDAIEMAPDAAAKKAAQEFFDNIGVARYPRAVPEEPSHVTLGGINLGVGEFTTKPDLAFEAVLCLKSQENQLIATEKGGLLPTSQAAYDTPRFKEALPFGAVLEETIRDGVSRPLVPAYSDISLAIQDKLHPPGDVEAETTIQELEDALDSAREGKLF